MLLEPVAVEQVDLRDARLADVVQNVRPRASEPDYADPVSGQSLVQPGYPCAARRSLHEHERVVRVRRQHQFTRAADGSGVYSSCAPSHHLRVVRHLVMVVLVVPRHRLCREVVVDP